MAEKPEAPQKLLNAIKDNTLIAKRLYQIYLLLLTYCFLVVLGTTDYQMLTNQASRLPISGFEIFASPITIFVLAFPVSLSIFIYFQLYLDKLNKLLTYLHDNYDSQEMNFISPWIINFAKYPDKGTIGKLQVLVSTISLWILLPLLQSLISFRFVKTHIPIVTYILGLAPAVTTLIILWFWNLFESKKLQRKYSVSMMLVNLKVNMGKNIFTFMLVSFSILLVFIIIPRANDGRRIKNLESLMFYDFSYQKLSTGKSDSREVYSLNWQGIHLEGANLISSVLTESYLTKASLQRANLAYANLKNSDLSFTDMEEANFSNSLLQQAKLEGANLSKAILRGADLRQANLVKANLQEANLRYANLNGTDFFGANLKNSNLEMTKIEKANFHSAILSLARLNYAKLIKSDFYQVKLNGADFKGTDITSAIFGFSDLSNAKNLTREQLCRTTTLFGAKLDSDLMGQVKISCPELLDDPGKEIKKQDRE